MKTIEIVLLIGWIIVAVWNIVLKFRNDTLNDLIELHKKDNETLNETIEILIKNQKKLKEQLDIKRTNPFSFLLDAIFSLGDEPERKYRILKEKSTLEEKLQRAIDLEDYETAEKIKKEIENRNRLRGES